MPSRAASLGKSRPMRAPDQRHTQLPQLRDHAGGLRVVQQDRRRRPSGSARPARRRYGAAARTPRARPASSGSSSAPCSRLCSRLVTRKNRIALHHDPAHVQPGAAHVADQRAQHLRHLAAERGRVHGPQRAAAEQLAAAGDRLLERRARRAPARRRSARRQAVTGTSSSAMIATLSPGANRARTCRRAPPTVPACRRAGTGCRASRTWAPRACGTGARRRARRCPAGRTRPRDRPARIVGQAWDEHIADPNRRPALGEPLGELDRRRERPPRFLAVRRVGARLDVEQDEVARVEQRLVGAPAEEPRRVERRVKARVARRLEQRARERRPLQRLAPETVTPPPAAPMNGW